MLPNEGNFSGISQSINININININILFIIN